MGTLSGYVPGRPQASPPFSSTAYFILVDGILKKVAVGDLQTSRKIVVKTGNYTLLASDSGNLFENTGASGEVDLTLPTWAAGLRFFFSVTAAQVLKVIAPGSAKIAFGEVNSAAGGNVQNNVVYTMLCLYASSVSQQWVVENATGNWTVT